MLLRSLFPPVFCFYLVCMELAFSPTGLWHGTFLRRTSLVERWGRFSPLIVWKQ